MDLKDKVVLIAGGARMGLNVADVLARSGCHIIASYRRSHEMADAVVAKALSLGVRSIALPCDLSNPKSISAMLDEVKKQFGRLDVIVNLASIYKTSSHDVDSEIISWKQHMEANAEGAYILSIASAPFMKETGGRIIHISDWTSASGRPRYADYSAYYVSKAALKATVEALALSLAPAILVNAIAPGPILPPPGLSKADYDAVVEATPLKRWGGVDEIVRTILFLIHTEFVTGETIRVDGGRHLN